MKTSVVMQGKSDTWSQKNTTHFIADVITSFWTYLKNRRAWSGIFMFIKERSILWGIVIHPQGREQFRKPQNLDHFLVALVSYLTVSRTYHESSDDQPSVVRLTARLWEVTSLSSKFEPHWVSYTPGFLIQ